MVVSEVVIVIAENPVLPTVLVFDVNETLIDIESLSVQFDEIFGDAGVLREWFGQLVMYSMTATLSGCYVDFFTLGRAVLGMVGDIHGVKITDFDLDAIAVGMQTMPAHPEVDEGLGRLREYGYRLVTLTNSPPTGAGPTPLENAGLGEHFENQFSVDPMRMFKPATPLYIDVAHHLQVPPSKCMMVAAHVWDTIGAQAAGFSGALITRAGNAPLLAPGLPQPNLIATDLDDLADQLQAQRK
jgi:2-haloacid dehalogenase